jgi:hypothetical protein
MNRRWLRSIFRIPLIAVGGSFHSSQRGQLPRLVSRIPLTAVGGWFKPSLQREQAASLRYKLGRAAVSGSREAPLSTAWWFASAWASVRVVGDTGTKRGSKKLRLRLLPHNELSSALRAFV